MLLSGGPLRFGAEGAEVVLHHAVLVPIALLVERLAAHVANEWLFTCVHAQVDVHVASAGYHLVAVVNATDEVELLFLRQPVVFWDLVV